MAERKLRNLKLGLGHTDLSSISPDVLADALVGLDNIELDLKDTKLTPHQAQSIFHMMASCENLALKSIDVSNNNFSSVPADVLAEAIFRLESVGLNNTHLTPVQINAIFKRISSRKLKKRLFVHLHDNGINSVPKQLDGSVVEFGGMKFLSHGNVIMPFS